MIERRKTQRERILKPGSVSFGVAAIVDCTILNMSAVGACLEFPFRPVLPKSFFRRDEAGIYPPILPRGMADGLPRRC